MNTVKLHEWTCNVNVTRYSTGGIALQLTDVVDGSPIATASVNMGADYLKDNEFCIKTWSENEGVLEALVEADIVTPTGAQVFKGYVSAPVVTLNEQ